eukprot:403342475
MNTLNQQFGNLKKAILGPLYAFFKSDRGNKCLAKAGPIIVVLFYLYQAMHLYFFIMHHWGLMRKYYQEYFGIIVDIYMIFGIFLMYKVNYLYTIVRWQPKVTPKTLKTVLTRDIDLPKLDEILVTKFSYELAETKRFSNMISYDTLEQVTQLSCHKCKEFKPLRTHHCSVCNQCIVMMDHHCMWANACVGLHNHAIFLQLNFFGMIGALFSVLTIRICDEHTFYQGVSDSGLFFTIIKYLDLLIGKFLMILFAWNMYVAMQGYTHLEFKDLMESQIRKKNFEAKVKQNNSEEGLQLQSNSENNSNVITHNHVKFNYGYKTLRENLAWVFGTTSFFNAFMFVDWFHDERLKWTGVEWTVIYYWDSLMDFYEKQYGKIYNQDYDQKLEELDISIKDE